mmetsp:Transcript_11108/g.34197  ORF Transcript_11108/g.34197 Transcript_11108/m.34197 type:complete len:207 (-) Transcript_11108:945-1565(-)
MSKRTNVVNVIVVSCLVETSPVESSFNSCAKTASVPAVTSTAELRTRRAILSVMTGSDRFRGGWPLTDSSQGSTPKDWAGGPSMMMLIQSTCMGFKGGGRPRTLAPATIPKAASDVDSWNVRKFRMLWKMALPSSTAWTMLASSSSANTTSAASFATSVPATPMATPTSAAFRAGASFTPSPVMATTAPAFLNTRTTASLWRGETR